MIRDEKFTHWSKIRLEGSGFRKLSTVKLYEDGLTDNHRIILTTFFRLQKLLQGFERLQLLIKSGKPVYGDADESANNMSTVWALLQRAHIFEFPYEFYSQLYHESDVYTIENVMYEEWKPSTEPYVGQTPDDYCEKICAAGKNFPYPAKMPFDVNFIAWGGGSPISPLNQAALRIPEEVKSLTTLGLVVAVDTCWEILVGKKDRKDVFGGPTEEDLALVLIQHWDDQNPHWNESSSLSLAPWMVTSLMGAINDNETFIEAHPSSLWDRQTRARFIKKEKRHFIPRPYYTVVIKPQHLKEQFRKSSLVRREVELAYRFDRRGNWATRVMRGKLRDLTDELRKKLTKRKYRVWTKANPPDAEAMAILMKWEQRPPAFDEYVATLRWWRVDTIIGKEELPYIPSTRKLAKTK